MREPSRRRIRVRRWSRWRRRLADGPQRRRPVGNGAMVDVAVEARLFGRVPLLTLDATVDIQDAAGVDEAVLSGLGGTDFQLETSASGEQPAIRRSTVEAVLQEANETLDSAQG